MSWQASANAKQITHFGDGSPLSPADKCVLMLLAEYSNPDSGYAYPSVATLAKFAGMKERGTRGVLARLKAGGVIQVQPRNGGRGLSLPNFYSIVDRSSTPALPCTPAPPCTLPLHRGAALPLHRGAAKPTVQPTEEPTVVEEQALDQTTSPASPGSERRNLSPLVKDGWLYFLERTGKSQTQYLFNRERQRQGEQGFQSLIAFAKRRGSADPHSAAAQLFKVAVERLANSDFHNGKNNSGQAYLDWHQLFKGKDFKPPTKLVEFWLDDARWERCS